MGRLLNEKEIINKNIESYLNKSTSEYSRFLENTPSFVTYYNKSVIPSTIDEGLEGTHNFLGNTSSLYYKKVENFPIYGIDTISLDLSREDFGANTSYEGSGVILPNTIKPLPQDYFAISYIGQLYLFRINSVINDKLNGKNFYKIEFSFNKILKSYDEMDFQISGNYSTIYNNIGTNEKCVIEQSEKLELDYIKKVEEKLMDFYTEFFLDSRFNLHLYKFGNMFIYNQMATNFILDNNVMVREREFNNSIYIADVMDKKKNYLLHYKKSIYYALEKRNHEKLDIGYRNSLKRILERHTPFALYREPYMCLTPLLKNYEPQIEFFEPYDEDFIDNIKNNILYLEQEDEDIKDDIIEDPNPDINDEPDSNEPDTDSETDENEVEEQNPNPDINDGAGNGENKDENEEVIVNKFSFDWTEILPSIPPSTDEENEPSEEELPLEEEDTDNDNTESLPNIEDEEEIEEEHLDKEKLFENLVIKFLNNRKLTEDDLDTINEYDYCADFKEFFFIPLIIYILKEAKSELLSKINY